MNRTTPGLDPGTLRQPTARDADVRVRARTVHAKMKSKLEESLALSTFGNDMRALPYASVKGKPVMQDSEILEGNRNDVQGIEVRLE